jgi:16S rRNA processing protein RimM
MPDGRLVTAGRVGRSHGLDGRFHVIDAQHDFAVGTTVSVGGEEYRVARRGGTDEKPLIALAGLKTREAVRALGGELLLVREEDNPLSDGEWLVEDLIGLEIEGHGRVEKIIGGSSCDVLELADGTLVPLINDAVRRVDVERGVIEIDRRFLRLEPEGAE